MVETYTLLDRSHTYDGISGELKGHLGHWYELRHALT